ncbi:thylakoid membrane photosystem I accumulation factor [Synechococcus sp. GFB01]|uniref:thylakoid membrane photosystem I accumulation factor n=1 Tax=Synechococcus sp. GFB01 TaxID=1662190 RepID=UPI000B31B10B|nr:thylakoid membrane photosystem I accumulation factor [Synechococcus sp. GFB01]
MAGLLRTLLKPVLHAVLPLLLSAALMAIQPVQPALASLTNNTYDGNIYALYAGNGSLVPPRSTLQQALAAHRPAVLIYYLDDDTASKQFAPVVSELQRLWGNSIELIPLVTDPLQNRSDQGPADPAHYWHGHIPQVVVFDADGRVLLDAEGQVGLAAINEAVSQATGIPLPEGFRNSTTVSINELNAEVVSR